MRIGYARTSIVEKNAKLQVDVLTGANCENIFIEEYSGKSKSRPELKRLIDTLKEGDVVIVQRLDRLGKSLKDLIELLDCFKQQGVQFISINENIDTTTTTGKIAFDMIDSIAQFERRLVSERTKTGLDAARARGRKGGRKAKLTPADIKKAKEMLGDPDMTKSEVAERFNVSRPTLNKWLYK